MSAKTVTRMAFAEALKNETLTPFGHALAGALGGVVSNALIYPLDTVKTRIQGSSDSASDTTSSDLPSSSKATSKSATASSRRKQGVLYLLLKIWREEGVDGFFRGFGANMLNTFSQQFAYFFWHNLLRTRLLRRLSKSRAQPISSIRLNTPIELLLGALAGAFAQVFTIPVAVIATRQQLYEAPGSGSGSASTSKSTSTAPGFLETGREIISESGLTGLWTGLKPGLVLTANPAITYGVFERVKGTLLAADGTGQLTPGKSFVIGVLSKTLATVVTYPYIFAKVRLQAKQNGRTDITGSDSSSQPSPESTKFSTTHSTSSAQPTNSLQLDNASLNLSEKTPTSSNHPSYAAIVATDPPHASTSSPQGHFVSKTDIQANTLELKSEEVPLSLSERTPESAEEVKDSAKEEVGEVVNKVKEGAEEVKQAANEGTDEAVEKIKEKAVEVKQDFGEKAQAAVQVGKELANKARKSIDGKGALWILQKTYEREGFKGWYVGMQAQILKAVLTQGILFALKNQFERYALILILLAKRSLLRKA